MTPGLFEEGLANTTREAIPKFRFEPSLAGDIVLGHQISWPHGTQERRHREPGREHSLVDTNLDGQRRLLNPMSGFSRGARVASGFSMGGAAYMTASIGRSMQTFDAEKDLIAERIWASSAKRILLLFTVYGKRKSDLTAKGFCGILSV